jgi:hypothetical protein
MGGVSGPGVSVAKQVLRTLQGFSHHTPSLPASIRLIVVVHLSFSLAQLVEKTGKVNEERSIECIDSLILCVTVISATEMALMQRISDSDRRIVIDIEMCEKAFGWLAAAG